MRVLMNITAYAGATGGIHVGILASQRASGMPVCKTTNVRPSLISKLFFRG